MSTSPQNTIAKGLRVLLHLYGNRGYSFKELCDRFDLSPSSCHSYIRALQAMDEFDVEEIRIGGKDQWRYRIRPESSTYNKEIKKLKKQLCG